ncbi:DUF6597 domain-containing transcriptional factor [Ekhidna sp.]|uniref:DUF6597 domain-containing transcriptional factor n=1 Tax=Ekhidna sp. TaxID=2608089 RepID=UPI003BAAE9FE
MYFESFTPSDFLKSIVKEYWIYENDDPKRVQQKIIPDGFSEIIIHYGDPYRINLSGQWEEQSSILFSSQISKYFFLENTARSGMLGIKLYPWAFFELFQQDVSNFTDKVEDIQTLLSAKADGLKMISNSGHEAIHHAENWLSKHLSTIQIQEKTRSSVTAIFESHGLIDIAILAKDINLSTRQFERHFKKVIGLTPKFYCRIIRFNYIFEVIKEQSSSWIRTALQSGYFDQSHFIKNFKEFTGEEPSKYGFDEVNLANFFLKK